MKSLLGGHIVHLLDLLLTASCSVLGPTGAGKSTFINLISGSDLRVGQDLESCTEEVDVTLPFEIDGRRVRLVDTPGFDDTTKSDADVLRLVSHYLVQS